MKKTLLVLVICFIGLSSKVSFSQVSNIVSLDSLLYTTPFTVNDYHKIQVFSSFSSISDSIIEKGVFITTRGGDIIFYDFTNTGEEIHIPIFNQEFDTTFLFILEYRTLYFQSYAITIGDTLYSDTIMEQFIFGVGLDEVSNISLNVNLYPTIIEREVNISSDKYPISLSIIDLFGREVFRKDIFNNSSFDLDFLKKGIYISRFRYNDVIINRKIIKR